MKFCLFPCLCTLCLLGLVLVLIPGVKADEIMVQEQAITLASTPPAWAPDEIIVKFVPEASELECYEINERQGGEEFESNPVLGFHRVRVPAGKTPAELMAAYLAEPMVAYVELNYYARAIFVPNDPYYHYQWNLDNPVNHGIGMQTAWDVTQGDPRVIVAVIDTGVAYETFGSFVQASDLAATAFVPGYNFVNNSTHANDDNGHGTHVTGTIAQSTHNALGVAGVAPLCSIMPIKVLDSTGSGTYTAVASGIQFAADNGAKVINMSLGGTAASITLQNALSYAYSKGVTIVCAAGNNFLQGNPVIYPAAYDDWCIAVGAIRYDQTHAPYSSTGTYVDLAAPHVSGAAALVISRGAQDPDRVRQALQNTAHDLGPAGYDPTYGWGLLDAAAAVSYFTPGDFNADHAINAADVAVLAEEWLATGPAPLFADVNNDGIINLLDFQALALSWGI